MIMTASDHRVQAAIGYHLTLNTAKELSVVERNEKGKQADGWSYGPVKDVEKKEHPCMVTFDELAKADQVKWVFRRKRPVALPRKRPLFRCENSRHSGENGQGVRVSHGEVFLSFHRFGFLVKH